jgi:hypothetical protein
MSITGIANIRKAVQSLNPHKMREAAERPVKVALYANTNDAYLNMEKFFLGGLEPRRRHESMDVLTRGPAANDALKYDLAIYDESVVAPKRALIFSASAPDLLVKRILDKHGDFAIPLSRHFLPFRQAYSKSVIRKASSENALFSLATALPDMIPSFIQLPWAVAEFTSDTAFLTMNQIRMAFLLAAASDRPVGYMEQKSEIASVIGSAFGWRALARQAVGKVPFGGGLIPKAAIAYAATRVVGLSLERYYSLGYAYTREERENLYKEAFQQGKYVARQVLKGLRPDLLKDEETSAPKKAPVERAAQEAKSVG